MNKQPYSSLTHPPITEAVLGIVCDDYETDRYGHLDDDVGLKTKFPITENIHLFETKMNPSDIQYRSKTLGFQHKNTSGTRIMQFRSNGFSYHALNNYPGWDRFMDEAMEAYAYYKTLRQDPCVEALGVRFINTIALADDEDVHAAFNVILENKKADAFVIDHSPFYRFVSSFPESSCQAIVNFGPAEQGDDPKKFTLDIDVITKTIGHAFGDATLKACLSKTREVKNIIFFNFLKERTWEKYR
jgi:uncharacterized protein (TIGR04255 family)